MNWQKKGLYRIESNDGYIIASSFVNERLTVHVARAPRTTPIIYAGTDLETAMATCERHLTECQQRGGGN